MLSVTQDEEQLAVLPDEVYENEEVCLQMRSACLRSRH